MLSNAAMKVHAIRLRPGDDLREGLERLARQRALDNAFVLTCVGSLRVAQIRMAGADQPELRQGPYEIVALSGTLSVDGAHLHALLSDASGAVLGGHVCRGCVIATTAELVLGEGSGLRFRRELDPETRSPELEVDAG